MIFDIFYACFGAPLFRLTNWIRVKGERMRIYAILSKCTEKTLTCDANLQAVSTMRKGILSRRYYSIIPESEERNRLILESQSQTEAGVVLARDIATWQQERQNTAVSHVVHVLDNLKVQELQTRNINLEITPLEKHRSASVWSEPSTFGLNHCPSLSYPSNLTSVPLDEDCVSYAGS
nr:hypothetical protein [Salmonid herpesvirus 1]